jgi:hypothetical protein
MTDPPAPPPPRCAQTTKADVILPLMVGAAFLLQPIVTQTAITVAVVLQMWLTWWIGVKLQWIPLHMAMRYQTRIRRDAVRHRWGPPAATWGHDAIE